ncbi:MAG: hypothetical protein LBB94_06950 [Clostridiales bacterium]|jgi:hypothetical protein|nr:hypothetical protein [Clostridiales bacterium]
MKALFFTAIVIPVLIFLSAQYMDAASKNHINAWNRQRAADFYALEKNSLDMLFIGSSHSYCTFSPALIDRALGTESFQFGMPLQHPDSSYFTLKEALATQSPSVVVMELYWDVLNRDFEIKQADTLFQAFDNEDLKRAYIKEIFPWNEKIKYAFPFIRYQQDFLTYENSRLTDYIESRFGLKRKAETPIGEERYDYRGFMYCDYVIPESKFGAQNQYSKFDGQKWKFSNVQQGYLEKIIGVCRSNDIRLLFVTAPVAPVSIEKMRRYDAVHSAVSAFAQKNKIPYLDFNTENQAKNLFENKHFRDDAHLNYSGVTIADAYFADWVKSLSVP